jgi:hypothetical protein
MNCKVDWHGEGLGLGCGPCTNAMDYGLGALATRGVLVELLEYCTHWRKHAEAVENCVKAELRDTKSL